MPLLRDPDRVRFGEHAMFNALHERKRYEVMQCDVCGMPLNYTDGAHGCIEFTFGMLPYHVHGGACSEQLQKPGEMRKALLARASLHSAYWRNSVEIMLNTIYFYS